MFGPVERYFVVPHTHWDREWYRPFEHFRLKLGTVVDEVLDTLERDSEFRSFTLDGQAIVLEDYVAIRPENESRLRSLIAAGRIEIGPSYVLPDEFLVGGEALVRNLLIGRAVCQRFGGQPSAAGYLPDSFGHPLQLPQILAGFGIDSFLFSRGLGDEVDDLGLAFRWVAPDGSAVRALQLLADYSNFANISGADDAEARVRALLERFGQGLERADVHEVVLCNGTDHWPIQPEMPAVCAELERRFPGSAFTIARYGDYVSALRTGELASWSGELLGSRLWNVLRGVNSARLYLKQANERAEQRLLSVETLAALSALRTGGRFPFEDFTFAWRELLKCHPHDSICGCSCDEVHRDMLVRYASLDRTLDSLSSNALAEFAGRDSPGRIGLVNPLPFARRGVLRLQGAGPTLVGLAGFEARTVELAPAATAPPREGDRIDSGSACRLLATEHSRSTTAGAAGGSTGYTRSRTKSTWATSTTSARSRGRVCGAARRPRRGSCPTGRCAGSLRFRITASCSLGSTTSCDHGLRPSPCRSPRSSGSCAAATGSSSRQPSRTQRRTTGSGPCSRPVTLPDLFAPKASSRSFSVRSCHRSPERTGASRRTRRSIRPESSHLVPLR